MVPGVRQKQGTAATPPPTRAADQEVRRETVHHAESGGAQGIAEQQGVSPPVNSPDDVPDYILADRAADRAERDYAWDKMRRQLQYGPSPSDSSMSPQLDGYAPTESPSPDSPPPDSDPPPSPLSTSASTP